MADFSLAQLMNCAIIKKIEIFNYDAQRVAHRTAFFFLWFIQRDSSLVTLCGCRVSED